MEEEIKISIGELIETKIKESQEPFFKNIRRIVFSVIAGNIIALLMFAYFLGSQRNELIEVKKDVAKHESDMKELVRYDVYLAYVELMEEWRKNTKENSDKNYDLMMKSLDELKKDLDKSNPYRGTKIKNNE